MHAKHPRIGKNIKPGRTLAHLLAQAEGSRSGKRVPRSSERVSHSGGLPSPRRELDIQVQWLMRILA